MGRALSMTLWCFGAVFKCSVSQRCDLQAHKPFKCFSLGLCKVFGDSHPRVWPCTVAFCLVRLLKLARFLGLLSMALLQNQANISMATEQLVMSWPGVDSLACFKILFGCLSAKSDLPKSWQLTVPTVL